MVIPDNPNNPDNPDNPDNADNPDNNAKVRLSHTPVTFRKSARVSTSLSVPYASSSASATP